MSKGTSYTTESFLAKCKELHPNLDFSQVLEYPGIRGYVTVSCPVHGQLTKQAANLVRSNGGCAACGRTGASRKGREYFLTGFAEMHGDRYDYSLVPDRFTANDKIPVICREHGVFNPYVSGHKKGTGCPVCVGRGKWNTDSFKQECKRRYPHLDFSLVEYTGIVGRVRVVCPRHGEFTAVASELVTNRKSRQGKGGFGCWGCANEGKEGARLAKAVWVGRFIKRHGRQYDYSLLPDEITTQVKINVICPAHGVFSVLPHNHKKSGMCPKCNGQYRTTVEFIAAAKKLCPRLDFSETIYTGANNKVTLICPTHGRFQRTAADVIKDLGSKTVFGCQKCSRGHNKGIAGVPREEWITRFEAQHGAAYSYELLPDTILATRKIPVLCPEHGLFNPVATHHVRASRCPKCVREEARSRSGWGSTKWAERQKERFASLYVVEMKSEQERFYKVGITYNKVGHRLSGLPYTHQILAVYQSMDAVSVWRLEVRIKALYKGRKYIPSQVFAGRQECFSNIDGLITNVLYPLAAQSLGVLKQPAQEQAVLFPL
ncbi:DUF723 domain-containing protein [Hymenobacter mucosus]|uniref:Uncharacterized protein n=1 Tax=Hymenobacter mucosus TaxID=1411120 RepID=A0A239AAJ3_9BACT|nr:DUF723 domain-containing protein [Hymenobacter mucosus]SNR92657.1 Protein of unknown function [Hymenobacter mucosus]